MPIGGIPGIIGGIGGCTIMPGDCVLTKRERTTGCGGRW
jgi:hypothetical protein